MKTKPYWIAFLALVTGQLACTLRQPTPRPVGPEAGATSPNESQPEPLPPLSADVVNPADMEYIGAFRLPGGDEPPRTFAYGGNAMTFNPDNNSLFITGHERIAYGGVPDGNQLAEVSIPAPVVSRNIGELNTAEFIQGFQNIFENHFVEFQEIPKVGLQYLNRPETGPQIHIAWGEHLQRDEFPSHGWFSPNLSAPDFQGEWFIGNVNMYSVNGYMFEIPREWADAYTGGRVLATGRYRDGGQGAQGPSLFAIAPWERGNPPVAGATIPTIPLLLYGNVYTSGSPKLTGYSHADEWSDAEWLTAGSKSAVIFIGTKGLGNTWYGCKDGTVWPENPPYPPACPERGWWADRFESQIIFYDPAQLGEVARGNLQASKPQPYAILRIDTRLFNVTESQQKSHVASAAFDRARGLLYIMEPLVDDDKPIIHVWRIQAD
ncbi:MAG: hypothetical protein C4583_12435 [Anaerolineaceae bacterium]|nr:MAG: hypothetical protein C4583_12435 [Anaerolineaceae bacterium]